MNCRDCVHIHKQPTPAEQEVLSKIRATDYGEVIVKIKAGKPVLVTESKTTRLD